MASHHQKYDADPILPDETLFNPALLFPGRAFPAVGTVMDLTGLRAALHPRDKPWFEEPFIPDRIYVRAEMQQSFHELVSDKMFCKVFSGSPGIGKSILLFLVAIFRTWTEENRKVSYLRHTQSLDEQASIFAMIMSATSPNMLQIRFHRSLDKKKYPALRAFIRAENSFMPQYPYDHPDVRAFVDGPIVNEETYRFTFCRYFCTSGSGMRIKHENRGKVRNFVLGGWKHDTLKEAIMACSISEQPDHKPNQELLDEIYFVMGGRIRDCMKYYKDGSVEPTWADEIIGRISTKEAKLCLSQQDCRSTSEHIDSIRTMFRVSDNDTNKVDMIVDSQFMLRSLVSKIAGSEYLDAYHTACWRGLKGAAGVHFEELLHWHLSQPNCFDCITSSVRSSGTGSEGVKQLTNVLQYWIPSIPNFVNIDSAIVGSDGHVWCFQFTIERTHGWKNRCLKHSFINHIPNLGVQLGDVSIVYVVPSDVDFNLPNIEEANTLVVKIDCLSMDTVRNSLNEMFASVVSVKLVSNKKRERTDA